MNSLSRFLQSTTIAAFILLTPGDWNTAHAQSPETRRGGFDFTRPPEPKPDTHPFTPPQGDPMPDFVLRELRDCNCARPIILPEVPDPVLLLERSTLRGVPENKRYLVETRLPPFYLEDDDGLTDVEIAQMRRLRQDMVAAKARLPSDDEDEIRKQNAAKDKLDKEKADKKKREEADSRARVEAAQRAAQAAAAEKTKHEEEARRRAETAKALADKEGQDAQRRLIEKNNADADAAARRMNEARLAAAKEVHAQQERVRIREATERAAHQTGDYAVFTSGNRKGRAAGDSGISLNSDAHAGGAMDFVSVKGTLEDYHALARETSKQLGPKHGVLLETVSVRASRAEAQATGVLSFENTQIDSYYRNGALIYKDREKPFARATGTHIHAQPDCFRYPCSAP